MTHTIELFYETRGAGPPLLLMHGGLGLDHTMFRPWLEPLELDHRLIYYDHRGNGRSPRPASWAGVNIDTWVDDARDLLDELRIDQTCLLGHSYGGFIAQRFAVKYPERLTSLILSNTTCVLDYSDEVMSNAKEHATPEQFAAVLEAFSGSVPNDETLRRLFQILLPLYFRNYNPAKGAAVDANTRYSARAFNRSLQESATFDTRGTLPLLHASVLILAGRADWLMPVPHGGSRLAALIQNSKLIVFEESGHFPFIEERDAFVTAVRNFTGR